MMKELYYKMPLIIVSPMRAERIWKTGMVREGIAPLMQKTVFSAAELERIIRKAQKAAASADKYAETHAAGIREAKQRKKNEKKKGR